MTLIRLDTALYIEVEGVGPDPLENAATTMQEGLCRTLEGFPAGEVVKAAVRSATRVGEDEAAEEGLLE